MTRTRAALRHLTLALQGIPPPDDAQWMAVIELANQAWLGPTLYLSLADVDIADDVRNYLSLLYDKNLARNRKLRSQLIEAAIALNRADIEPIVLKGAIRLCQRSEERLGARIMSDLDLSVAPSELSRACAALADLGYREIDGLRGMGRSTDPGLIELRDRPSRRSSAYLFPDLTPHTVGHRIGNAFVRTPTSTAQALHLIVHDMLKEGDYWRWRLDLRHLNDLAELAICRDGLEWDELASRLADPPARRALELQLRALADLFAVSVPGYLTGGAMARAGHSIRMCAAGRSRMGAPARIAGNLVWGFHRLVTSHAYRWQGGRDFLARAYRVLADEPKGSRL